MSNPNRGLDMLRNVDVCLSVELGKTTLRLKDVMALAEDSVVPLDRMTDELLDVMVNGRIIAKAEIIDQEGRFALRIAQMGDGDDDGADGADGADKGEDVDEDAISSGIGTLPAAAAFAGSAASSADQVAS